MAVSPKQVRCPSCQRKHAVIANREKTNRWARAHATFKHEERICEVCDKRFVPVRNSHRFCSTHCHNVAAWAAKAAAARGDSASSAQEQIAALAAEREKRKAEQEKRKAERGAEKEKRKAERVFARAARKIAREKPKPRAERAEKPGPDDWKRQVEHDLAIADATERFEASRKWTARQRAYAQKRHLRDIGWKGPLYV